MQLFLFVRFVKEPARYTKAVTESDDPVTALRETCMTYVRELAEHEVSFDTRCPTND